MLDLSRPAFMDEYEKLEVELKAIYEVKYLLCVYDATSLSPRIVNKKIIAVRQPKKEVATSMLTSCSMKISHFSDMRIRHISN